MGYQFLFERSPFKPQKNRDTPSGITPWFLRKGLVHPDKFISTTPHMTFAHGEEQIAWLKKRASKKHTSWLRVDFWGFTVRGIHHPPVLVMFFFGGHEHIAKPEENSAKILTLVFFWWCYFFVGFLKTGAFQTFFGLQVSTPLPFSPEVKNTFSPLTSWHQKEGIGP